MYKPKTLQEESVHNNRLMGLIFWTNWRVDLNKIKIPIVIRFFEKWVQKYQILRTEFEGQFLGFHEKKKRWISFGKMNTQASLARAVPLSCTCCALILHVLRYSRAVL